ncbi:MAG: Uma2 family endonuclease, partial [Flammeovirgaceae bacterium]|nr:Uma2 family endonuclease [Flammeovirgaceae bacterium]
VVEIISPSTFYRDSHEKFGLYERVGALEYWLIEPANQVVEVFRLEGGRYVLHSVVNAEEGEEVHSHLLAGFSVKKSEIFSLH